MDNRGHCPKCQCEHPISNKHTGKMAGVAIGAAVGKLADKSPWAPVVGGLIGIALGEAADRTILPKCPTCGTALELISAAIS